MKKILSKYNEQKISSFDLIENIIISLINKAVKKLNVDEIIEMYQETIDTLILETIKNENLRYISGTLTLTKLKDYLDINIEFYFQDQDKRWIKKEAKNSIEMCKIKEESIDDNQMKFEIEHP